MQEKREFVHYARIPPMAQLDMMQRYNVHVWDPADRRKVMQLVNSREYEDCKIAPKLHDR